MKSPLEQLTFDFATQVVLACDSVKNRSVLKNQLIRSATSIGANWHEAHYGYSDSDFAAKLQIALKECIESQYWLELMVSTHGLTEDVAEPLLKMCRRMRYKLVCSLNTVKTRENDGFGSADAARERSLMPHANARPAPHANARLTPHANARPAPHSPALSPRAKKIDNWGARC